MIDDQLAISSYKLKFIRLKYKLFIHTVNGKYQNMVYYIT